MHERFTIVYGPELVSYDLGEDHPLQAERYTLTMSLLSALGWLDDPGIAIEAPRAATISELLSVHAYPYLQAVQQGQAIARGKLPYADLGIYGLGTSDDPLFPDIHDAAALYAGATIQAMTALLEDRAIHSYSPAGGLHHAQRTRASGFCVYNDCAAALAVALKAGRRVAYVDFDAHHGDGVQAAFYDEPRVLTVSIHESGEYLFPGTGEVGETGTGDGKGACLNIPPASDGRRRRHPVGLRPHHRARPACLRTRPPPHPDGSRYPSRRSTHPPFGHLGPLPAAGYASSRCCARVLRGKMAHHRRRRVRPVRHRPAGLDQLHRHGARPRDRGCGFA
jgi:hypothetical protein